MLLLALIIIVWLVLAFRMTHHFLQFFQIEEYDNQRFQAWAGRNFWFFNQAIIWLYLVLASLNVLAVILVLFLPALSPVFVSIFLILLWGAAGIYLIVTHWKTRTQVKKALVYTQRARRLLVVAWVVQALLPIAFVGLIWGVQVASYVPTTEWLPDAFAIFSAAASVALSTVLAPYWLIVANILLAPFEAAMRNRYRTMAQARLHKTSAVAIGITGSYGKTSTKDIIAALLETRYSVVKSPQSYNTLMGICKIINRGDVQPQHEYFVVEAGAYTTGEIASIVTLVKPKVGVLTAIGPQHLERFGTIEAIAKAKYEIMAGLPPNGLGVFNADDERVYALAKQAGHVPVALYGFRQHLAELTTIAEDVRMSPEGMCFTVVYRPTGERADVRTRLLGMHTVSNLLAAITVALHCGVPLAQIVRTIAALAPTPHRLELKSGAGGTTILDDAYNSNPVGACNALEVLGMFTQGQRILVTPGFIELGPLEAEENHRLGAAAASTADYAILVGVAQRTDPIKEGLLAAGFAAERIMQVPGLQEGIIQLRSITRPGDTVLLLNDLPDTYELVAAA
ncbi:MAG: UDP-N-acetylmuramoyl-tripeptide--D-alanyl-D-alanine ligase [Chloroflexaceae bacterium]|nr:UDP-N-acetylmuramoyl-tripeptide--D-alanyl-D-alanine ligase [Chloroflexaceae bacterium]